MNKSNMEDISIIGLAVVNAIRSTFKDYAITLTSEQENVITGPIWKILEEIRNANK